MRLHSLAKSQSPPVMASSVCTVKIRYERARNLTVISLLQLINVNDDISALRGFKITEKEKKMQLQLQSYKSGRTLGLS